MALVQKDISTIKDSLTDINLKLDNKYVTKEEFRLTRTLVYGCAGIMLSSMIFALVYLVITPQRSDAGPTTTYKTINTN